MVQPAESTRLVYEAFEVTDKIRLRYRLGKKRYTITVTAPPECLDERFHDVIAHLGIVFAQHMFKYDYFSEFVVEPLHLDPHQIEFFQELFDQGLAEFRYTNRLPLTLKVRVIGTGQHRSTAKTAGASSGAIVMNGGGKDSIVAGELLRQAGIPFTWMAMNPRPYQIEIARISGREQKCFLKTSPIRRGNILPLVAARRDGSALTRVAAGLARRCIRLLPPEGKYAGTHTTFTDMLIFLGVLLAAAQRSKYVVGANEFSASEPTRTVNGYAINHQYGKSWQFEKAINDYIKKYLYKDVHYFSLLRPLYELDIARIFARSEQYHSTFVSCNRQYWCGTCPKCAFIYLALFPWLPREKLNRIWGADLFEVPSIRQHITDMLTAETKPFECVGTTEECYRALRLAKARDPKIPFDVAPLERDTIQLNGPHAVPEEIWQPVRRIIEQC